MVPQVISDYAGINTDFHRGYTLSGLCIESRTTWFLFCSDSLKFKTVLALMEESYCVVLAQYCTVLHSTLELCEAYHLEICDPLGKKI